MPEHKLGIQRIKSLKLEDQDLYARMKEVGFDATFTLWGGRDAMREQAKFIRSAGLIYHSQHMLWQHSPELWEDDGKAGEDALAEHLSCLHATAEAGVPVMVTHVIMGMTRNHPTALGVKRFETLIREAEKEGVVIAFENTEGEAYLETVMKAFQGSPALGFCFDTGHEMCYNHSKDMLTPYGGILTETHLNDNLGISDPAGMIDWHDDLHLLPFDGIADWEGIARRIKRARPVDVLMMEINTVSKPGRNENERYAAMTPEDFLRLAYERVLRLRDMVENAAL